MAEVIVNGLSDLQKLLDTLPAKLEANVMRSALRAGMKPIQEDAKANAAVASGLLRDGLKVSTKLQRGQVVVRLRATGKHGYVANWVEFGTAAHTIAGKNGGMLAFGGGFARSVEHPGARAHPFMRPAIDSRATEALVATGEYIKRRLSTRHGLDTDEINIEVES